MDELRNIDIAVETTQELYLLSKKEEPQQDFEILKELGHFWKLEQHPKCYSQRIKNKE